VANERARDANATIDQVAALMDEFRLTEAKLERGGLAVSFRRRTTSRAVTSEVEEIETGYLAESPQPTPPVAVVIKGIPVTSPMNGIYYDSPNPGSPPFVRVGDTVTTGQIIGLIEAMKVFNEIPSPVTGTVIEVVAKPAQIVNPGEVLLYVE
jgi:acetyl-CoA carboxylase biotin carboxyl carrier protein